MSFRADDLGGCLGIGRAWKAAGIVHQQSLYVRERITLAVATSQI